MNFAKQMVGYFANVGAACIGGVLGWGDDPNIGTRKSMYGGRQYLCHREISQTIVPLVALLRVTSVGKSSMGRGALNWFHDVLTYGGEVIEYSTIFSLKIHLNPN